MSNLPKDQDDPIEVETVQDRDAEATAPVSGSAGNNSNGSQPPVSNQPAVRDKAAQFLKEAGHPVVVTAADNRRVLRKIDMRLLPLLLFVYCLQSLDKTTLSYASVFGLLEDTGLVRDQFSWLGSIVYIAQLVFQPLVAYALVRFPIGKFSSIMVFCWGAILCCMTAAHNFTGLMVTRLLLGAFEASVGKFSISSLFQRSCSNLS
jgi:sugar phosphate permease